MTKIVLGFSGGVDSSVCAALLKKQGFEVHGLYLDNADEKARSDAEETAARLGIELRVLAIREDLDVPVKFIGVGEGVDDIIPFNAEEFVDGIIEK